MKGIILAGGTGSRLYPMTCALSKQLLPIYDKPMIFYSLSTLMLGGIREILVITTPAEKARYERLLDHFKEFGLTLSFAAQENPNGIAEALIIGKDFIAGQPCALILGDNFFYGHDLPSMIQRAIEKNEGATVFGYYVRDPERYGVVEFTTDGLPTRLVEKPKEFVSNYAVTGLYIFDCEASEIASSIKPSDRGELEITDVNRVYLENSRLNVEVMGRGFTWLDTGTPDSLLEASQFVHAIEKRQGLKICCPEEIAFRNGWVEKSALRQRGIEINSPYGVYLRELADGVGF